MSQRSEKYSRQLGIRMDNLENRMSELEGKQLTSDRFSSALSAVQKLDEAAVAKQHRQAYDRARYAETQAKAWRRNTYLALILAVLLGCIALVIGAKASEGPTDSAAPKVNQIAVTHLSVDEDDPLEEDENEKIEAALLARATRLDNVTVTHYDVCLECCGKTDGITASGVRATPGVTVAVDPDVIPLGSDVLVDYGDGEIHYYRADDIGGSVKGNHIDLCVESHAEADLLGIATATVYWVSQEDD